MRRRHWKSMPSECSTLSEGLNFDLPIIRMQKSIDELDRAIDQLVLSVTVAKEAASLMGPAGMSLKTLVDRKRDRGKWILKRLREQLHKRLQALQ